MAKRVRVQVGDVFEMTLRDGCLAYVQMVSETPIGDVVRVLAGRHCSRPESVASLVAMPHEYLIFAMLVTLVRDGHAQKIGNWPVPDGAWSGLRLSPRYDKSRRLDAWVVTDGRNATQRLEHLPDSLRKELPIWQIGDSVHVLDMLRASNAGGLEASELEAWRRQHGLRADSAQSEEHDEDGPGVAHFALFGTDARLDSVIADLGKRGFSCRVVTGPDVDGQVLVIKADPLSAPGFIDDQWDLVEEVANAAGGEYDGWEASAAHSA